MLKKIILTSLFFVFASPTLAASSASVNVENNVSTNSNSSSQTTTHTDITVETDGNVSHYESSEPGKIEVKSENGTSEIKVNGEIVSGSPHSPTSEPTNKPSHSPTPTPNDNDNSEKQGILGFFQDVVNKIFSLFD